MLVIVLDSAGESQERIYRSVSSKNIRKVAKSIHSLYPDTDYPTLEASIFNGYNKGLKELVLKVPSKKSNERT